MAVEIFIQGTAPTVAVERVKRGDFWLDESVNPRALKVCVEVTPAVVFETVSRGSIGTIADSGTAAPAGGTGATEGAYDTAANRNIAITALNDVRVKLNSVLAALRQAGILRT